MPLSQMIVASLLVFDLVRGSSAIFEMVLFGFVACFATIETFLTFLFRQLIVISFWDCIPLVTLFQMWYARRRRKPPDKISFSFRDAVFRRLIVVFIAQGPRVGVKIQQHLVFQRLRNIRRYLARRRSLPFVLDNSFSKRTRRISNLVTSVFQRSVTSLWGSMGIYEVRSSTPSILSYESASMPSKHKSRTQVTNDRREGQHSRSRSPMGEQQIKARHSKSRTQIAGRGSTHDHDRRWVEQQIKARHNKSRTQEDDRREGHLTTTIAVGRTANESRTQEDDRREGHLTITITVRRTANKARQPISKPSSKIKMLSYSYATHHHPYYFWEDV